MIQIILLIVWFWMLIKWADWLVDGASNIAKKMKISETIIWLTIVAFGTSLPELVVNLQAALWWSSSLAIGNIVGSNIANILLILWVTSIMKPLPIWRNTRTIDIPFMILLSVIFAVLVASPFVWEFSGVLSRSNALILILIFGIFLYYLFFDVVAEEVKTDDVVHYSIWKSISFMLLWLWWLVFWWDLIVKNTIILATQRGMSERIIWLTIVALGTSLPELATSITAALKWKTDLAIWNIVWSNIFNIWFILWVTWLISPLDFWKESVIDLVAMLIASVLLFLSVIIGRKELLQKNQWIIFVLLYLWYMWYAIFSGS